MKAMGALVRWQSKNLQEPEGTVSNIFESWLRRNQRSAETGGDASKNKETNNP